MFAHLKSSKSFNTCLLAPLSILLFAPATSAQSNVDGMQIAQSKYVQTYSFGKKTTTPQKKTQTKSTSAKSSSTKPAQKTTTKKVAKKKKLKMIVGPKQYTSAGGAKWQKFTDSINLKPGQEKLPLKFTILNGSGGTPPLRAIRATLSGRVLFTEKDFKGKRKLSINMTNALTSGATQIIFTSYGAAGSAFKWQITSATSPEIISLSPSKAEKSKPLVVKGKNLPAQASAIKVTVDKIVAKVSDTKEDGFKITIPKRVKPGKNKIVSISVGGQKLKTYKISIQSAPVITFFSHIAIAGNQVLRINGKNFSTDKKDVEVTFGSQKGIVMGASEKSISVMTPDFLNIPGVLSVKVKVSGVDCKKPGKILGSMRNIPNDGNFSPFSVPNHLL